MARKTRHSSEFWVGRFAVEIAVAVSALEMKDTALALDGLKEVMQDFQPEADDELLEYLDEIRRERHALTPVSIAYRGDGKLTGQEIASKI